MQFQPTNPFGVLPEAGQSDIDRQSPAPSAAVRGDLSQPIMRKLVKESMKRWLEALRTRTSAFSAHIRMSDIRAWTAVRLGGHQPVWPGNQAS